MYKTQERKLKEYIDNHGSHSPGISSSQPTLNAINSLNMTYENFGMPGGMKPPDSPMSAASSTGTSEVRGPAFVACWVRGVCIAKSK